MKRILIPTDRSANANHALNYALELFKGSQIEFTLFQSFQYPVYTTDIPVFSEDLGIDEALLDLERLTDVLREKWSSSNYTFKTIVEAGPLSINLEQLVDSLGIDLIVMGTKGASGISAAIIGSNTSDVIQSAICPVLAVPENAVIKIPARILFAIDNKGLTNANVIALLTEISKSFQSHVHLMNVLDEGKMTTVDEAVEGLKLDHILEEVEHTFHFENSSDKAHAIENYLNQHNIDMLAVVPRKNNFFDSLFNRSVTRKLTLHTKVPMLAMPDLGN